MSKICLIFCLNCPIEPAFVNSWGNLCDKRAHCNWNFVLRYQSTLINWPCHISTFLVEALKIDPYKEYIAWTLNKQGSQKGLEILHNNSFLYQVCSHAVNIGNDLFHNDLWKGVSDFSNIIFCSFYSKVWCSNAYDIL